MTKRNTGKFVLKTAQAQRKAVMQLRESIVNNESTKKKIERLSVAINPLIVALSGK